MTREYYERNAKAFEERTLDRDMEHLYAAFLTRLPAKAKILDAGCGPGRDAAVFLKRGFDVTAVDASHAMIKLAAEKVGHRADVMPFQAIDFQETFDGIWANSSLLHVPREEIDDVFLRLTRSLKPRGIWYMSFKLGQDDRVTEDGRSFYDYTESSLRKLIARHPNLSILDIHNAPGPTPELQQRLHATVQKVAG
jgi:SAM-dependent methyltransferase